MNFERLICFINKIAASFCKCFETEKINTKSKYISELTMAPIFLMYHLEIVLFIKVWISLTSPLLKNKLNY